MTGDLLFVREAATRIGVSYPTLKQWIYKRKIRAVRTPGGHYRIPRQEIERISGLRSIQRRTKIPVGLDAISGRNKLEGTVMSVQYEGLLAQVTIDIGGQRVTAIITRSACKDLGLRKGVRVDEGNRSYGCAGISGSVRHGDPVSQAQFCYDEAELCVFWWLKTNRKWPMR